MTDKGLFAAWAAHVEETAVAWDNYKTQWGENLGWLAAPVLHALVQGYEYSRQERWLQHLTVQVDELLSRLKVEKGFWMPDYLVPADC